MQLPNGSDLSEEAAEQLIIVFEKHKKYCSLLRRFNSENVESADTDFNLYMLSMLHVYKGFLDDKILKFNRKLEIL